MKLLTCVSFLVVACSAGNLFSTDHSSLQSILDLRSDSVNTKYSQHWPSEQLHKSFTPSVYSPVNVAPLHQNDHSNAHISQHWQDETNWATYQPSFPPYFSHVPSQHWTNEQLSSASLAHNPTVSWLPQQYNDINTKFVQTWPSEQLNTHAIQFAHTPLTASSFDQHDDTNAKFNQLWQTEQFHTAPLYSLIQPVAVEKQVPVLVPVPIDHVHTVVKPYPIYVHNKQQDNIWLPPSTPSTHFHYKKHNGHHNHNGNPGGVIVRKRVLLRN